MDVPALDPYTARMLRRTPLRPPLAALVFAAGLLHGCGAKTGLTVPDVPVDREDVADVPPPPSVLCVDEVPGAGPVRVALETRPQLSVADVFFLIDRTGSMDGEIDNVKANLQNTIVPQIVRAISDVQFGVATYADFPLSPYGDRGDVPFTLVSPIDRSVSNVQGAVNSTVASGGGDNPEAMVEALFQVASGEGYGPWISARSPCAGPSRSGYACFRREALPIVVLIADAPSHNGPGARNAYTTNDFLSPSQCPPTIPNCRASRGPHTFDEAVGALNALNARVIGVNSGSSSLSGLADLNQIATATSTVTAAGAPLVITIRSDGADLDARVVSAVQTFTRQVRFNASARVLDLDPAVPASRYVRAVRPASAAPADAVQRFDESAFYGVIPGTRLTFSLELVSPLPRARETVRVPARVQFLGDGRANLGYRDIEIVIPAVNERCDGVAGSDGGASLDAALD